MGADGLPARLAGRLARGRAMAESRMGADNLGSTATVRRKTGNTIPHPTDVDRKVPEWADVLTDVPCRLASRGSASPSRSATIGGVEVQLAVRELHFPIATEGLRDDDLAVITAGERADSVWHLLEVQAGDQQTALRIPVVEVQPPTEWG